MHQSGPTCLCLQESFHGNAAPLPPRGYILLTGKSVTTHEPTTRPPRGIITLVKRGIPYSQIPLSTSLEALAIRIKLNREYTICNLYISPSEQINLDTINQLIAQLPRPFLILGA